jgi:hypothetical protein
MQIKFCYFNQHWNIYLYSGDGNNSLNPKWLDNKETITKDEDGGIYRLTKYEHPEGIPVHTFGFLTHNVKHRPGHGGEWSSNSTAVNKVFNVDIYEIALDQISVAVPMVWLKELLGDKVVWEPDTVYGEWISEIKEYENEQHKWVTL